MKKIIIILLVVLLAGGAYFYFWHSGKDEDKKENKAVESVVKIKKGHLSVVVEATGAVIPEQEVEIKCKASGEIVELPVDVSDTVRKGDLLLKLDPENEERSVRKAKVSLAVSEARLAQSKLELKIAERDLVSERLTTVASLESAKATEKEVAARLKRLKVLREKKMSSDEDVEAAISEYAQAQASLKKAESAVADLKTSEVKIDSLKHDITIAEQQVESDRIAVDDALESLDETKVVSPIDGVVAVREVQVGQIISSGVSNVSGGTTVMTLADLNKIYVLATVDESDIGKIKLQQSATVSVDAYPKMKMKGRVVRIATKGTITSNVVTFEVKVEVLDKNKKLLKPEMTANVAIAVVDKPDALLVPVNAVESSGKGSFVVCKNGGKKERLKVKLGHTDGEMMEVLGGLSEGDRVVVSGNGSSWKGRDNGNRRRRRRGIL